MNRLCVWLSLLFVILPLGVSAQFTIPTTKKTLVSTRFVDTLHSDTFDNAFFSKARWEAEQRALRKERNTVEFNVNLLAAQTQFVNWASGGDNTFSARSWVYFRHQHKRTRFNLDYRAEARYGMNFIDSKLFKNEDEFKINVVTSWTMQKKWSYAATANLRSQFSEGYKSLTDHTKISTFMAPGFLDVSVGFKYKKEGGAWDITLSPLGGSVVLVLDDELSNRGINGVPAGKSSKGQIGPSVRVNYDKEFAKKAMRYRASLYSFTNIKTTPLVRWENILEIRATKFLTTTIYGLLYYDKTSGTTAVQYNYSLSIGIAYRFKNK